MVTSRKQQRWWRHANSRDGDVTQTAEIVTSRKQQRSWRHANSRDRGVTQTAEIVTSRKQQRSWCHANSRDRDVTQTAEIVTSRKQQRSWRHANSRDRDVSQTAEIVTSRKQQRSWRHANSRDRDVTQTAEIVTSRKRAVWRHVNAEQQGNIEIISWHLDHSMGNSRKRCEIKIMLFNGDILHKLNSSLPELVRGNIHGFLTEICYEDKCDDLSLRNKNQLLSTSLRLKRKDHITYNYQKKRINKRTQKRTNKLTKCTTQ